MPLVATAQIASSGHNAASDSRSSSKSVASSSAITALTDFPRSDFRPALTATSFADRVDCSIARRSLVYAYMPDWGLNPTNPSMGGLERSPAIVTLHHRAWRQEPARDIPLLQLGRRRTGIRRPPTRICRLQSKSVGIRFTRAGTFRKLRTASRYLERSRQRRPA